MPTRPRRWHRAALLALAAVYLPTLVPFAVGPLTECGHCVTTYLRMLVVVPGVFAGFAFGGPHDGFYVAAAIATAAVIAGATCAARRLDGRDLLAGLLVLSLPIGAESLFLGAVLRA